jgi:23S rRNA (uracil1939-C5)-methyltransferase
MDIISPLLIEKVVYGGQGLARHEGKVIFVPFTIPHEKITAKITTSKKNFSEAQVLRIIDQDPHRIQPRCIHFGQCGGCQLQHMDYIKQLEVKTAILIENIGPFYQASNIEVIGLPNNAWLYREHIKLTYQNDIMGYHGAFDKNVFPINMCPIFSDKLEESLYHLQHFFKEHQIHHADVRLLKNKGSFIAAIKCDESQALSFSGLAQKFLGVSLKHHQERLDFGTCTITQNYLGKEFEMDVWSFMQSHRLMAEILYQYVIDHIPSHTKLLLDLYCGSGILSILSTTKNIPKIIGIELNPSAITCAKNNQKNHHLHHIQFMAAPAEHVFQYVKDPIDFVIINPPREGLSALMMEELLKMENATFCYVSCNPTTLSRDLKKLNALGWEVTHAKGFDLFPQTTHLETVCIIKKR